jgi:ribonuclease P protein component
MAGSASPPKARSKAGVPWKALGGEDLKALLAGPAVAKTTHLVLHTGSPGQDFQDLSTDAAPDRNDSVDNNKTADQHGLALVVPKRHARRAATRNLIKRQMREGARRHLGRWPACRVLIRLRGAFDGRQYPSAASRALRAAVRGELDLLFDRASATP